MSYKWRFVHRTGLGLWGRSRMSAPIALPNWTKSRTFTLRFVLDL